MTNDKKKTVSFWDDFYRAISKNEGLNKKKTINI